MTGSRIGGSRGQQSASRWCRIQEEPSELSGTSGFPGEREKGEFLGGEVTRKRKKSLRHGDVIVDWGEGGRNCNLANAGRHNVSRQSPEGHKRDNEWGHGGLKPRT